MGRKERVVSGAANDVCSGTSKVGHGGAGRDGRKTDEALDPAVRFGAWELLETNFEL